MTPSPEWYAAVKRAHDALMDARDAERNHYWATCDMSNWTYNKAKRYKDNGLITQERFWEYCYLFRDQSYRYSDTGKDEARRWAAMKGLPLPSTDR